MADLLQSVIQQASSSVPTELVSTSLRSVMAKTTVQMQLMRMSWNATVVRDKEVCLFFVTVVFAHSE